MEHAARMIYLTSDLEVRQLGSQPVISGKFPYGSMAVLSDRGTVRKEQIMPGAFAFTLSNPLAGKSTFRAFLRQALGVPIFGNAQIGRHGGIS